MRRATPELLAMMGRIGPEEYMRRTDLLIEPHERVSAETKELQRVRSLDMWKTRKRTSKP